MRGTDGMIVKCRECDWRRSSASDLAVLSFVFDHEHRYGVVQNDNGQMMSVLDSEVHDPGGLMRRGDD